MSHGKYLVLGILVWTSCAVPSDRASTEDLGPVTDRVPTTEPPSPFTVCESGCEHGNVADAIGAAEEGATITIGPGEYALNVTIDKSLTLRGEGPGQTRLVARLPKPALIVRGNAIEANLETVSIEGGRASGGAAGCISNPEDCRNGIVVSGRARVTLTGVKVSAHADTGLWAREEARLVVTDSEIVDNRTAGVAIADEAEVTLDRTSVSNNKGRSVISAGIRVEGRGRMTLTNSSVSNNTYAGVWARENAVLEIDNSQVKETVGGFDFGSGIVLDGLTKATIRNSAITANGTETSCLGEGFPSRVCSGIMLLGQSNLNLIDTEITGNTDWGIGSWRVECGYGDNRFIGSVTYTKVTVAGNDRSGNHDSAGNPGAHPWSDGSAGQVCLP